MHGLAPGSSGSVASSQTIPAAWQKHLTDGAERLIGGAATAFKLIQPVDGSLRIHDNMLSGDDP